MNTDIILENARFRLTVGENAIVKSLICLATNEECIMPGADAPLFSVTQERPFNNEVKLAHPNKRTTYPANRIRREGDRLIVGFEIAPYEAVIDFSVKDSYMAFTLADFIVHPTDYPDLRMTLPPVAELRLIQLAVKNRACFGEWLNVSHDDRAAVCVLATSPYARIDSEKRPGHRIMSADAVKDIRLKGTGAALAVSTPDVLMDALADIERDFDLPRGVDSRRSDLINASVYWTADATPLNIDEHIRFAKQGGFRLMLLYYKCIFREEEGYSLCGDYDYREEYPNGRDDLKLMLDKIKAAGIQPGLHVLQTHIGLHSRYATPVADHRLNLTRRFTLARPLSEADTTIHVEEYPEDVVMDEKCRVLRFGGELIRYESHTDERPYAFTGCTRGAYNTNITTHPMGEIGGILDVSEYGATSAYLDQNSSLADEVSEKIASTYNAGFRFIYFDGSEGTNIPYGYHIPNAQYRIIKQLDPAPLFSEGAAKAHFSWHFLSGGNAFDIFPPEIFKEKIDEYPVEEAPRMRQDFTRLNFGWWGLWTPGTQPDHWEYGTSRAAAWDCPSTIQINIDRLRIHPRRDDLLEVMRRWEAVRAAHSLTEDQKTAMRSSKEEHTLIINEEGSLELVPYRAITCAAPEISAFTFTRGSKHHVLFWHKTGEGRLSLPLNSEKLTLHTDFDKPALAIEACEGGAILPAAGRLILSADLPEEQLIAAFENALLI